MRLNHLAVPLFLAASLALGGCAYNADLGRDQLLIVKDDNLAAEGEKAWADTLPFAARPMARPISASSGSQWRRLNSMT